MPEPTSKLQLPDFSDLHMLVIGDIMVDRYIYGTTNRMSPEAPVPVVNVSDQEDRLGGAANVCANLKALGAQVSLISIAGQDAAFDALISLLSKLQLSHFTHIFQLADRKTTVKSRVMVQDQHLLRMDEESTHHLLGDQVKSICTKIKNIIQNTKIDGIILQDYNKGMLTDLLISNIISVAKTNKIDTFVDPKYDNFFSYSGCTFFKPNQKELLAALNLSTIDNVDIHTLLTQKLDHETTFVTLGKKGIYYQDNNIKGIAPTSPRVIADVCGAGDTVISVASLCYCKKMPLESIAIISNIAGGQVCEQPGVAILDRTNLENEMLKLVN